MSIWFGFPSTQNLQSIYIIYCRNSSHFAEITDIIQKFNKHHIPISYDYGLSEGDFHNIEIQGKINNCKKVILFVDKELFTNPDSAVTVELEAIKRINTKIICVWLDSPKEILNSLKSQNDKMFFKQIKKNKSYYLQKCSVNRITKKVVHKLEWQYTNSNHFYSILHILTVLVYLAVFLLIGWDNYFHKDLSENTGSKETRTQTNNKTDDYKIEKKRKMMYFGKYEQDGNISNGKERIAWEIIALDKERILLLSDRILEYMPYNEYYGDATWENCTLRRWLNEDFYNEAFSEEEKEKIELTTNRTVNQNIAHNDFETIISQDKVFLLSLDECEKYVRNDPVKTDYPKSGSVSNESAWWLRTSGTKQYEMTYCSWWSLCSYTISSTVDNKNVGVRPALWLHIDGFEGIKPLYELSRSEIYEGARFKLGKYEQDGDLENGEEDIEWVVTLVDNNIPLAVTDKILYSYNVFSNVGWTNEDLVNDLNRRFENEIFTNRERKMILKRTDDGSYNKKNHKDYYIAGITNNQLEHYSCFFEYHCMAAPTQYLIDQGFYTNPFGFGYWWICSSNEGKENLGYIKHDGKMITNATGDPDHGVGVRPAIWIDMSKLKQ